MFLENGFKGKNSFWLYLTMFIVFFVSQLIGAIPFYIVVAITVFKTGSTLSPGNPMDLSSFGINTNLNYFLMIFPFVVTLIALLFLVKNMHKKNVKDVITARNKIDWSRIMFSAFTWLALMVVVNGIHYYFDPQNMEMHFNTEAFVILVIITLIFIPVQSFVEEFFFRGYLMQGFAVAFRYHWIALLAPALIFGLLHSFNPEVKAYGVTLAMSQYLVFGILFGLVAILDEGIECTIGAHAVNNMFLAIFLTNKFSALQTPALFEIKQVNPLLDLIELIGVAVIFLIIAHQKYKWGNWCKIFGKVEKPLEV